MTASVVFKEQRFIKIGRDEGVTSARLRDGRQWNPVNKSASETSDNNC